MSVWIGLDGGDDHPLPAEHRAEGVLGVLLAEASLACTHMLYEPFELRLRVAHRFFTGIEGRPQRAIGRFTFEQLRNRARVLGQD